MWISTNYFCLSCCMFSELLLQFYLSAAWFGFASEYSVYCATSSWYELVYDEFVTRFLLTVSRHLILTFSFRNVYWIFYAHFMGYRHRLRRIIHCIIVCQYALCVACLILFIVRSRSPRFGM
jgi:hypothetical protein